MSTALANPVSLEEIERLRSDAIKDFEAAKTLYDAAHEKVARAAQIVSGTDVSYEIKFNFDRRNFDFCEKRLPQFIHGFDKTIWQTVYSTLNLARIMDEQAKREFRETIDEEPIPATAENLRATVTYLQEDSFLIFQRGLVNAFAAFDRRFKCHDGFKLGSVIRMSNYFSDYSSCSTSRDRLNDVERIFYLLDGEEQPTLNYRPTVYEDGKRIKDMDAKLTVHGMMDEACAWDAIQTPYFKGRRFKNGNLHLYFLRNDLVRKANLLLADYYGEVLGAGSQVCNPEDIGPDFLPTLYKDLAFYPTPMPVIDRMIELGGYIRDDDLFLEPSAGNGDIVDGIMCSHYVTRDKLSLKFKCYEIDNTRSATLRGKGYDVSTADFLSVTPTPIYDRCYLNPPFTRSRDIDHVTHALKFLKPGGILVAVMSARAEYSNDKRHIAFRALLKRTTKPLGYRNDLGFHSLPAHSFKSAGTNVNTVILAVTKSI